MVLYYHPCIIIVYMEFESGKPRRNTRVSEQTYFLYIVFMFGLLSTLKVN